MATEGPSRRRLLAAAGASLAGLAGCLRGSGPDDTVTAMDTTGGTDTASGTPDLDLREANVTGVAVEASGEDYRFSVTLYHDDEGEDGYANWWQVEARDGERLGRRDLSHAHGTREFTRSTTVAVPEDVSCVVVRGHDQTHEYGGRAMLVAVDDGATRAVDQGSAPRDFTGADCPG